VKKWGHIWLGAAASEPKEKPKRKLQARKGERVAPAPHPVEIIPEEIPKQANTKNSIALIENSQWTSVINLTTLSVNLLQPAGNSGRESSASNHGRLRQSVDK